MRAAEQRQEPSRETASSCVSQLKTVVPQKEARGNTDRTMKMAWTIPRMQIGAKLWPARPKMHVTAMDNL